MDAFTLSNLSKTVGESEQEIGIDGSVAAEENLSMYVDYFVHMSSLVNRGE